MSQDPLSEYRRRFSKLREVAKQLEAYLENLLEDLPRIDRVSARAKAPESFVVKATKRSQDGSSKYAAPLDQIQDQIAARAVVFYQNDVETVSTRLRKYLRPIEWKDYVPDSEWEFGYFGRHWVFALPKDTIPVDISYIEVPRFFEMQVKTLFQHAWSEANHDLSYKPVHELTPDQQRRFAFTSAQSWGADRIFEELRQEIIDSKHHPH